MVSMPDLVTPPLVSAVAAIVVGIKAAGLRARGHSPALLALDALVLALALVPAPVLAGLITPLFDDAGDPKWPAFLVALALTAMPLAYLPVRVALCRVNAEYRDTIRLLGMGTFARSFRLELPLGWPAMLLGALLAFTRVFGELLAAIASTDRIHIGIILLFVLAIAAGICVTRSLPRAA
jgi:ABC-type spermidine/putrescine transport system permease subunit II